MKLKILSIKTHPDPILRKISTEISIAKIDKKIKELIANMANTLISLKGAGLAAPQVGKNIRLILVNQKNGPICMLNPQITWTSEEKEIGEEGCFSVRDESGNIIFGNVARAKEIKCDYYNPEGEKIAISAQGLLARVIQHEIDHLNGILFIDKLVS